MASKQTRKRTAAPTGQAHSSAPITEGEQGADTVVTGKAEQKHGERVEPLAIVGIGASAGGLEALELFLRHLPVGSGLAFVIVQHLDPTHKGMLPELLQRSTTMTVLQVKERMKVKPNCVYVIPPNKDLSILHGTLHLFTPTTPRGLRLPIDLFLRSLAEDLQERSIGVILSGMGSDGSLGLQAIKAHGGLTLVQEPSSAKFDKMPRSAIDAGAADLVAPVEEMPGRIIDYFRHAIVIDKTDLSLEKMNQSGLEKIFILLRSKTGHDFSMYKKSTMYRRIERRMGIHQIDKITTYARYLQENAQEAELLFKELLIGVTSFFRDPAAWEHLQQDVIPLLLAAHPGGGMVRAWSVGCSTGEEAYSLAIAFTEVIEQVTHNGNFSLQIFATDLNHDAIERARKGVFPPNIAADVSDERLRRFFIKEETGYRVRKEIRDRVTFATQNVVMDPPFTKLDIIVCRNLLIYLTSELQKKLLPLFHFSLKPGGILFLGVAETASGFADIFSPFDAKSRIYQRRESLLQPVMLAFPSSFGPYRTETPKESPMLKPPANLQTLADQMLLRRYTLPAVLVNDAGDILYINGRTGKYLEPASGKANWNIFAMAREGLRFELTRTFQQAVRQKETLIARGLKVGINGGSQIVDITVQPIEEPGGLQGLLMVVFRDVATPPASRVRKRAKTTPADSTRVAELELELLTTCAELKTTREEMQASQEELKSANEELQSTNEELQSTNEELTTSKEEMQSMNEELQTINVEQQAKMEEYSVICNDMQNLLNSTEIAVVFLDNQLNVRSFTTGTNKLFKLIPGDVGRPLSDIATNLNYPELSGDALEVLRTLVFTEKQIPTNDGRWLTVRIMPYRTMENVINGVVITFIDITAAKTLQSELHAANEKLRALLKAET